jgi:hydroxyacyl-ACP dehydratase HTD2-like protein with hotdog domain
MLKIETEEPAVRFFEDFHEGQELPIVTRGPMMVGHQVRWAGACDNYESEFHHDEYVAKAQGLPGILLSGPLMASWLLTTVQEWMGGDAKILRFSDQNRGSTMPRDMAFFHGTIRRTYIEDGRALIELDCWISNQKGEVTTPGSALVQIPRRSA